MCLFFFSSKKTPANPRNCRNDAGDTVCVSRRTNKRRATWIMTQLLTSTLPDGLLHPTGLSVDQARALHVEPHTHTHTHRHTHTHTHTHRKEKCAPFAVCLVWRFFGHRVANGVLSFFSFSFSFGYVIQWGGADEAPAAGRKLVFILFF